MDYEPLLSSECGSGGFATVALSQSSNFTRKGSISIESRDSDSQCLRTNTSIIQDYWLSRLSHTGWSDVDRQILHSIKNLNKQSRGLFIGADRSLTLICCNLKGREPQDAFSAYGTRRHSDARASVKFVNFFLEPCYDVLSPRTTDKNCKIADHKTFDTMTLSVGPDQLASTLSSISFSAKDLGFLWIRLQDIINLPEVAARFIDGDAEECFAYFSDRRAHSTFHEVSSGFYLSICSFEIPSSSDRAATSDTFLNESRESYMRKLYIYATVQIVISYEVDFYLIDSINPEMTEDKKGQRKENFGNENSGIRNKKDNDSQSKIEDSLSSSGLEDNYLRFQQKGISYLIATLLNKSLALQDPILKFCDRGISYYHKQIKDINIADKLERGADGEIFSAEEAGVRVREIENCLVLIQGHILESISVISQICARAKESAQLSHYLLDARGASGIRYLYTAMDNYRFTLSCLKQDLLESAHLHEDLKAVVQLREKRTGVRIWMHECITTLASTCVYYHAILQVAIVDQMDGSQPYFIYSNLKDILRHYVLLCFFYYVLFCFIMLYHIPLCLVMFIMFYLVYH